MVVFSEGVQRDSGIKIWGADGVYMMHRLYVVTSAALYSGILDRMHQKTKQVVISMVIDWRI